MASIGWILTEKALHRVTANVSHASSKLAAQQMTDYDDNNNNNYSTNVDYKL